MIDDSDLKVINPVTLAGIASAAHVTSGIPIPKVSRVKQFSPEEWEQFTEEYASELRTEYAKVRRFGGTGDMGIDVACFTTNQGFDEGWDNHQCKRYHGSLAPSSAWLEIGKIIYYSYCEEYPPPRKHFFCASAGISTKLEKLLAAPLKLKEECKKEWSSKCENDITNIQPIPLTGSLLTYFEQFDFTIFSSKSVLDLLHVHERSTNHVIRFGGGLPLREPTATPPHTPSNDESRYIKQLLGCYEQHTGITFVDTHALSDHPSMATNLKRQRERFYHAEALRNFARDTVPQGTFANLQEEIYYGVADECDADHPTGLTRMTEVLKTASAISSTTNPLAPATTVQDRQGICHQLANEDRLIWIPNE